MAERQLHNIDPVFNSESEILILGSFPSVKSREQCFFYGHPSNRFWLVLSSVLGVKLPVSVEEKKEMLQRAHIAVWDVIAECDITLSQDSTIENVIPNDLQRVITQSKITKIFTNGKTAHCYYQKYQLPKTGIDDICLPSTSPANAAFSLEKLIEIWKEAII